MVELQVCPDHQTLMRQAAFRFFTAYESAMTTRGRFIVALSGGETPRSLYQLLSTEEFAPRMDWNRVYVCWGDERCVPPEDRASNYHMAREALLNFVPIPMSNIYRIQGELEPREAALAYEARLRDFFTGRTGTRALMPRFDLVLLGLGADGHTASLFPGSEALDETARWVVPVYVPLLESWRVTLTAPAINSAVQVMFLVAGESKAEALHAVLHGPREPRRYPAQLIQPVDGKLLWLVDQAAASRLPAA